MASVSRTYCRLSTTVMISDIFRIFCSWLKMLLVIIHDNLRYGGGNSTTTDEVSRFQHLFYNPSWMVWGRAFRHQKLALIPIGGYLADGNFSTSFLLAYFV